jgi:hypothetical protein
MLEPVFIQFLVKGFTTRNGSTFRPSKIIGPKENAPELDYSRFYRKPGPRSLRLRRRFHCLSWQAFVRPSTRRTEFLIVVYFPFCVLCPISHFFASSPSSGVFSQSAQFWTTKAGFPYDFKTMIGSILDARYGRKEARQHSGRAEHDDSDGLELIAHSLRSRPKWGNYWGTMYQVNRAEKRGWV